MTNDQLQQHIQSLIPAATINTSAQYTEITVPVAQLKQTCGTLKHTKELGFDYMISCTAVDWKTHFTMVYHLSSTSNNTLIVLKTEITDRENPSVDSVCEVWRAAEFQEREVFDLFGIRFNEHPDLRRIFLDDDFEGYPLRKDFEDEFTKVR